MLSWEYPPAVVGGLSRHVLHLSRALVELGHMVTVYSRAHPDAPPEEDDGGVRVVRVPDYPPRIEFDLERLVPWVLAFNVGLLHRIEADVHEAARPPDVLHGHDWLIAYAAAALAGLHQVPLVATIHATEYGRHQGKLPGPTQVLIDQVERWLMTEASRLITCSEYMRGQVTEVFGVPSAHVDVIPNGVDPGLFDPAVADAERSRAALAGPEERLVAFAGRLVYEKGVQTALAALALLERSHPFRFVVAGAGSHRGELESEAERQGLAGKVRFVGFLNEAELRRLYAAADVVVVPSLYEPFGLVALETMAAGTPVVAADTGGLREIVDHEINGLRFVPGDPRSLAAVIERLWTDQRLGRSLALEARSKLADRYSWDRAALKTVRTYRRTLARSEADTVARGHASLPPAESRPGRKAQAASRFFFRPRAM